MRIEAKSQVSREQFSAMGAGHMGYVKLIGAEAAGKMLGHPVPAEAGNSFFVLYNAEGSPISIAPTYEMAVGSALEHDIVAARVH